MLRNNSAADRIANVFINLFLTAFILLIIFPMLFMLTASFMPSSEIFSMPYRWIPKTFYFTNYFNAVAGNDRSFVFIRLSLKMGNGCDM